MAASLLLSFLLSISFAYVVTSGLHKFFGISLWWTIPVSFVAFIVLLFLDRSWKITEREVARSLNSKYPVLEESAELLLQPFPDLPFLQQLQATKTEQALQAIPTPVCACSKFSFRVLIFGVALMFGIGLTLVPDESIKKNTSQSYLPAKPVRIEKLPAAISAVTVRIFPPAYTARPSRSQDQMNFSAEEGATVQWQIKTSSAIKNIFFIFNDSKTVALTPLNKEHTLWSAGKVLDAPGFYQLKMDTVISELYTMEMVKDQLPTISIQTPKPNTLIDFGQPKKLVLNALVTDDYGIKNAAVFATISTGRGEGVKFAQQQINFEGAFGSQLSKYQLRKMIDLAALGMQPGDELYFYVKAIDSKLQEKRSDIYIVSIADTAQLMSMEGLLNGIPIKPEYFRSQRQIIIESEQLIKDKNKIGKEVFRNRSNNLGIDQKLLRLRYGKFLGEENESNEDQEVGTIADGKDFGNAEKILDAYTDKHDDAETVDFFEISTKNQLKATLTEMWNAELKLRVFKPEEALPYEYKALRLLKDLQQKSRAYVAKTSIATTPLKPEKRLTAELDKIIQPFRQITIQQNNQKEEAIRTALSILEQLKKHGDISVQSASVLQKVSQQLANKAVASPAEYLPALQALKKILGTVQFQPLLSMENISVVEKALHKMIDPPAILPSANKRAANGNLSKEYFKTLDKLNPE
ncbi:MAG: hypothetical protein JWP81_1332 [Ferruginibacter sp.]|nr:hypothetical protein [Ferruginibacter sp.]